MCPHTICYRQQFSRATCEFVRSNEKCLRVSSKDRSIERRQHRTQNEKLVHETSAKMVYTLFVFSSIFLVCFYSCSRIMCSRVLCNPEIRKCTNKHDKIFFQPVIGLQLLYFWDPDRTYVKILSTLVNILCTYLMK